MSAYKFTDKQLEELRRVCRNRLNMIPASPHERLGYPPICKGNDVTIDRLTVEATRDHYKIGAN